HAAAAATGRRRSFDERVQNVRAAPVDIDGNSAERSVRKAAALEPGPRLAPIDGLPDAATGSAAVHAAGSAAPLVRRCVQDLIVRGVHDEIVRAGVIVNVQHLFPRLAAVDRLVHAALATRSEQW